MRRLTLERLEEIRALYGEQTIFHGVNELLAEIDDLREDRDRYKGLRDDFAARVRELESALRPLASQDCESWGCEEGEHDCAPAIARRALGPTRRDAP